MDDKKPETMVDGSLETPVEPPQAADTASPPPPPAPENTGVVEAPTTKTESAFIDASGEPEVKEEKGPGLFKRIAQRLNIYFMLLIVMLLLIGAFTFYAIKMNSRTNRDALVATQELTQEDLAKLANSDAVVGDPKQTLSIESNAIFAGKVLVRSDLDVAGSVRVGGTLSLAGVNIGGTSALDQIQGRTLTITDDSSLQGKVTIQDSLTVSGNVSVSGLLSAGQLSVETLQLNKDLLLNRHIDSGGSSPSKSNGGALGSGGTSAISGNDTAGTITINTGSSAPSGCFITVNFAAAFTSVPKVLLTPASSAAAGIEYYTTRTASSFSVCSASDPPDSAALVFDYFVLE